MSFDFTDATQALWFMPVHGDNAEGDWLAQINTTAEGRLQLRYRFRWYRDSVAWDSKDVKNWFTGEIDDNDIETAIHRVRTMIRVLQSRGMAGKPTELLRGNLSTRDFLALLTHQPFAHVKQYANDDEARKAGHDV